MDDLKRLLINAGFQANELDEGTTPMDLDDAKFVVFAARDWLRIKRELENFKTTGDYDADYQRKENLEEQLGHISGLLDEHRQMHGYDTVNDMFQAAKKIVKDHTKNNEEAAVGRIVPGVNTTSDVKPDTLKKSAAKFGNKVTKDGVPPLVSKDSVKKKI